MKLVVKVILGLFVTLLSIVYILWLIRSDKTLGVIDIVKHEFGQILNKEFLLHNTFESETKKYTLEVYKQSTYKSFTGSSSSHGFAEAYVVLKDKQGEVLLKPHWYASCDFIIGDLQIEWQNGKVYFTKFNFIDLKDYAYDCY